MGSDEMAWNGVRQDGLTRWVGMGWDRMGWDGMGWNEMGWDGILTLTGSFSAQDIKAIPVPSNSRPMIMLWTIKKR